MYRFVLKCMLNALAFLATEQQHIQVQWHVTVYYKKS